MINKKRFQFMPLILLLAVLLLTLPNAVFGSGEPASNEQIEKEVKKLMDEGDIPGLSLIIIRGDESVHLKGLGYADANKKKPVTADTLFELASCSKAFTALAALQLEEQGLIDLDAPVSRYLPWFYANYKGKKQEITIRQFLHQTSGMPFSSVAHIPKSADSGALEQTIRNLVGIELEDAPGKSYLYATVNYDVVGAVIAAVMDMSYEEYMQKNLLQPLGLINTVVGKSQVGDKEKAEGFKTGFFAARRYKAPVYRGNNPAGYIISNGHDVARWLKLQIGIEQHPFTPLIKKTQQRDLTVPADRNTLLAYAMGWMEALDGSGTILHAGLNPNFTSFIVFQPEKKLGVAVLANSNSNYTPYIAHAVLNMLEGKALPPQMGLGDGIDKGGTVFSLLLVVFLLIVVGFLLLLIHDVVKGKRRFEPLSLKKFAKLIGTLLLLLPFLAAIYLIPFLLGGVPWQVAIVWSPVSMGIAIGLLLLALGSSYLAYVISSFFPHRNQYLRSVPMLLILSLLSGGANAVVIFLITISLQNVFKLGYVLFYFVLAMLLYLVGRKELQTRLIRITFDIIYDLRVKLVEKIFNTSYQKFEKLDRGQVLATLNNDTNQLGQAANFFVNVASSLITVIGAFMFLATIAFWTTLVTMLVIIVVGTIYSIVTGRANVLFERARDTQNEYFSTLDGMNTGFKELSLHSAKKTAYKGEVEGICDRFRQAAGDAMVKFVNAFMVGESMLLIVLGAVGFGIPVLMPNIQAATLMSFIMVLLYLIGPVNGILNSIPGIVQVRVAWGRIKRLERGIPANILPVKAGEVIERPADVNSITASQVFFEYESEDEGEKFSVGPVNFDAKKGEIVFIVGGNGSGKTTLAKLLTGLYEPSKGTVSITNGKPVQLGEYFSVVFGDFHLFEKLYDVDLEGKEEEVKEYLEMLRLQEKVKIEDGSFSTIELSGGQRKRLALLRCYLEDRPIYLFDEVAADQDPGFRKFFYRTLLPKMKERGKIVIAITHDDHYFDVADRVVKMDMGKIELVEDSAGLNITK